MVYTDVMTRWEGDPIELISFLSRSSCRMTLLEQLWTNRTLTRTELRQQTDSVRTTVQRNLEALQEYGLIREQDREYRMTEFGRVVTCGMLDAIQAVDRAQRLEPVLTNLPPDELSLDWRQLSEFHVIEATTTDPYAPVDQYIERMSTCSSQRMVLPAADIRILERALETSNSAETQEIFLSAAVADHVASDAELSALFADRTTTPHVTIGVIPTDRAYYLGLLDDFVQIGVQTTEGVPQAMVETTDSLAQTWADSKLDEYSTIAEPFG